MHVEGLMMAEVEVKNGAVGLVSVEVIVDEWKKVN